MQAEPHLLEETAAAFQSLRRHIKRAQGFTLVVASLESLHSRDVLIEQLTASCPDSIIKTVVLTAADADVLDAAQQTIKAGNVDALMIVGIESLLDKPETAINLIAELNLGRTEWVKQIPVPVVLWVPRWQLGDILRGAPDFFDWRSDTLHFPNINEQQLKPLGSREWQHGADPRFNREERLTRIAELQARIAATQHTEKDNVVRTRLVWWDEIADNLKLLGEIDEALRIRQEEQLPVYEKLGDLRELTVTKSKIADILQQRGETDEALRIRQEEELPVYEKLGDLRELTVTKGKIADILQQRGSIDEALHIYREEVLPMCEKLGDLRSLTVAKGKIADILQQRGEIDEALRIRQEEQLSVYEKLGDLRELTMTKGKIADILQQRGETDEALRIRQEEQLPMYEQLGDLRSLTVAKGKIADILQQRGEIDEALRIRQEEELPVYEKLGDLRELGVVRFKIAIALAQRGRMTVAEKLLQQVVNDARHMQLAELPMLEEALEKVQAAKQEA